MSKRKNKSFPAKQPPLKAFARAYYGSTALDTTAWMTHQVVKCPLDLWVYQEILFATRPSLIIETGAHVGGSALFMANMIDLIGYDANIVSVELMTERRHLLPEHPRIDFWLGRSSTDPEVVDRLRERVVGERVMVILDSDHSTRHVLDELNAYHKFVTRGCYLIVEDTNPAGFDIIERVDGEGSPAEAIRMFDPDRHGFVVDKSREKFLMTFNNGGYLLRVS